ncbi:MAG: phosphonate metabolism protein/1,5-bisphosphokinase (PRPP-forming) PhnN [Rhodospirillaceae bacterium]|nr:phosphonate metabolism protein/1,5-bisphosphokinase (PRPP-forming) PhnN [Rhodospirillaceae bacterium]
MSSGRLVYLMGASGSGKDSVLNHARQRLDGRYDVLVAHRYVTRPAQLGHENYVSLSDGEYDLRRDKSLFMLDWGAHGVRYAVGVEVRHWLSCGLTVVMNGSRAYLPTAAARLPDLLPILIDVPIARLRQRLLDRGRESLTEIDARLQRAEAVTVSHPSLIRIDNSGPIALAGDRLTDILTREAKQ